MKTNTSMSNQTGEAKRLLDKCQHDLWELERALDGIACVFQGIGDEPLPSDQLRGIGDLCLLMKAKAAKAKKLAGLAWEKILGLYHSQVGLGESDVTELRGRSYRRNCVCLDGEGLFESLILRGRPPFSPIADL